MLPIRLRATDRLFAGYCRTGDPKALGRVFDRTAPHLLHVAAWLAGNRHDAEDLLQRTFLTAIEDRASFARERRVLPWLVGILTNHARNLQRERARRLALPARAEPAEDPSARAADRELVDLLARTRGGLASPYREVLELHVEQGLDAAEIAVRLGRPAGTVRTQIVRGLELLRRRLPSGFVAGLAPAAWEPTALAAMKAAVVAAAEAALPVPAAATGMVAVVAAGGGILMTKKIALVVPALVLLLGAGVWLGWPGAPEPESPATPPAPALAALNRTEPAAPAPAAAPAVPTRDREFVAPSAAGGDDPGFASLRVQVRWKHDGAPAADIGVSLFPQRSSQLLRRSASTDTAGVVVLRHITPGRYWLQLTHVQGAPDVEFAADEHKALELQAERNCIVRGTVVDADGHTVGGASVCSTDSEVAFELGRSDAAGRFAVPLLHHAVLAARKPGHAPSYGRSVRGEPGKDLEIELPLRGRAGAVRGIVRDPDGRAIAWATVQVGLRGGHVVPSSSPDVHLMAPCPPRVQTDRDGGFLVEDVSTGDSELQAWATGHGPVQQRIEVRPGEITELAITLPAGSTVTGIVRDAAGQPVANAAVGFGEEFVRFPAAIELSDAAGRFVLASLPAPKGRLRVFAQKDADKAFADLELQPGVTTEWNPVLGKGRTIAGTVLGPDDLPLPGAKAGIVHPNYQKVMRWVEADAAGRFELTNVGEKPVTLQAASGEATLVELANVAPDRRDVVLRVSARDLPTAHLAGRFMDALGRPVKGSVHARRPGITSIDSQQLDEATGGFAFEPVPAGAYDLTAWIEGYGQIPLGLVALEPGQRHVLPDVVLREPGDVQLTVSDAAGNPVDADHTGLVTDSGYRTQGCELRAGKGRLEKLQPGRYWFVCVLPRGGGIADADFEVRSGAVTHVELRAHKAVVATIRFRDPEPATAALAVKIRAETATGRLAGFAEARPRNREPLTQRLHLPVGVYRLVCRTTDGRRVEADLEIRSPDDKPELTIELPRR